jgi:hypothetical protein
MHNVPARGAASAVPGSAESNRAEQRTSSCRGAEATPPARRASAVQKAAGSASPEAKSRGDDERELRHRVYALIEVDHEGWRRWRGSKDKRRVPPLLARPKARRVEAGVPTDLPVGAGTNPMALDD